MAVVGTNIVKKDKSAKAENSEETSTVESARLVNSERRKPEYYKGSELLSEGHFQRISEINKGRSQRRSQIIERVKDIFKEAEETPLHKNTTEETNDVLQIKKRSMANKTITVGNTSVIFDGNGVANISRLNVHVYNALLRQPGYSAYTAPKPKVVEKPIPVEVEKVVEVERIVEVPKKGAVTVADLEPEQLAALKTQWADEEALLVKEEKDLIEDEDTDTDKKDLIEDEDEDEEDEEEYPDPEFDEFTMGVLKEAMDNAEVEYKSSDNKESLVAKIQAAWDSEDDDLREIIFDTLYPPQEEE